MSSQSDRSREEQKEEFIDSDEEKINFKLNEHVDCQDEVNKWLNAEILAVKIDLSKKNNYIFNSNKRSTIIKSDSILPDGLLNSICGLIKLLLEFKNNVKEFSKIINNFSFF